MLTNEHLLMLPLVLLFSAAVLYLAGAHNVPAADRKFLFLLALGALLARLLFIVSSYSLDTDFINYVRTSDALYYEYIGKLIADAWHAGTPLSVVVNKNNFGYPYWNGIIYYIAGFKPILVIVLNSIASVCVAINVYFITLKLSGATAARISFVVAAFFPSAILWSSLNLKDTLIIFVITLAVRHTLELLESFKPGKLLLVVTLLMALVSLRFYIGILLAMCISFSYVFIAKRFPLWQRISYTLVIVLLAGTALQQMGYGFLGTEYVLSQNIQTIGEQHQRGAIGGAAYEEEVTFDSLVAALKYLPVGIFYFLFAPLPWQAMGPIRIITVPEMVFLYFAYRYLIMGVGHLWQTQRSACQFLLLVIVTFGLIYSLGASNMGGVYRVRLQVIMLMFVFISAGMHRSWALNKIFGRLFNRKVLPGDHR
ncbi:MAG: hypothetical protein MJA84_10480 [Firmicutes bacterium]|nr:hypothetical protein [Bacillota bacterium]